jgi:hypothetical protein
MTRFLCAQASSLLIHRCLRKLRAIPLNSKNAPRSQSKACQLQRGTMFLSKSALPRRFASFGSSSMKLEPKKLPSARPLAREASAWRS